MSGSKKLSLSLFLKSREPASKALLLHAMVAVGSPVCVAVCVAVCDRQQSRR